MKVEDLERLVEELGGEIIDVGRPVRTVKQAVEATGLREGQVIKSLLFISEREGPVLVIVDGGSKVDLKKLSGILGKVRLATPEEVRRITGFEVGGLPPVGVRVRTIVDPKVLGSEFVVGGGGRIDKLLKISPRRIVEYQRADVMEVRSEG